MPRSFGWMPYALNHYITHETYRDYLDLFMAVRLKIASDLIAEFLQDFPNEPESQELEKARNMLVKLSESDRFPKRLAAADGKRAFEATMHQNVIKVVCALESNEAYENYRRRSDTDRKTRR